jgi:hypothetical protein
MQTLSPALTLKDVRDRIDEALYIYHPTDSSKWVAFFPREVVTRERRSKS